MKLKTAGLATTAILGQPLVPDPYDATIPPVESLKSAGNKKAGRLFLKSQPRQKYEH